MEHVLDINVPRSRQIRVELLPFGNARPCGPHALSCGILIQHAPNRGNIDAFEMPNCRHRALNFH
jgi:hypothetical protein